MIEEPLDLRLPALALCAWSSAIVTNLVPGGGRTAMLLVSLLILAVALWRSSAGRWRRTIAAFAVVWMAVSTGVALRGAVIRDSWVAAMAKERASARLVVEVRSDPKTMPGLEEDRAIVRGLSRSIEARGRYSAVKVAVTLVLQAPDARDLKVGAAYSMEVRLAQSSNPEVAATAIVKEHPTLVRGPGWIEQTSGIVRDGIQRASAGQTEAAGLVPALVDGDERALPEGLQDNFQAAGLLHLLAVSGTNFVLIGAAWMALAQRCGVRGRALIPVGMVGIASLVVLARAEPSVVRAAVMGAVALIGLGQGKQRQGIRALCACVCAVMLFDPGLALSAGFALSVLASAGILCLAGRWRDALAWWMPTFLAEAIAVALAAHVACLPLVVALSGRLSLIAIPANLAAAIVVGPTTVLGFLGGVVALASSGVGRLIAAPATWGASWVVGVAKICASLPHPDVSLASGAAALAVLVVICVGLVASLERLLRRPLWAVPVLLTSILPSMITLPAGSWPPPGWAFVACDVGQGDGLVVRLGEGRALVVDTGPDPAAMRDCLRDLNIRKVPVLVLTHFHADHVNGIGGVLTSAQVGAIEVTDLPDPEPRVAFVERVATAAHVPIRVAQPGEQRTEGDVTWQVLAPVAPPPADSDSPPNDASVVILVQVHGVRILLMGDEETGSQEVLAQAYPSLRADVLKVAHHGSAKQDPDLIRQLGAKEALISAGLKNRYGLPKASTLTLLRQLGVGIHRTDLDGALAVVVDGPGRLRVIARGS